MVVDMQSKPKKIPVSVLVVMFNPQGEFLLIERADKAGYWQSVTGSLDAVDELPLLAAVRELQEETGLQADADASRGLYDLNWADLTQTGMVRPWPYQVDYEIFPHWRHRYAEGVTRNTEHWFFVCWPSGVAPQLAANEHVGWRWVNAEEAQRLCFSPNNSQAITALAKHLKQLSNDQAIM